MQNGQYDPRLAGWVRALSLARAWTDPSWKILILVGFVAAPTVHFLTNSMAWLIGIAAVGFLPLVVCIVTDFFIAQKLSVLTSPDEFHLLQQVVDREVATLQGRSDARPKPEPIVQLPAATPVQRLHGKHEEPQQASRG